MHFSVMKIQFQAFFENSKMYTCNEKGRRYNAYGKGVGFSFFQIMPCFIKTVLSLQEIGAVSIET